MGWAIGSRWCHPDGGRWRTLIEANIAASAALLSRCVFPTGPLVVAVSGGADSLALMALAAACRGSVLVTAIHVDHGLRAESEAECGVVSAYARMLDVEFRSVKVNIAPGSNLEARARTARYAALPPDVCTGHTADDLGETVLLNLIRGAGMDGLAAFARHRPGGVQRPILHLRRAETVQLCAVLGWQPVDDPMNHDPRFRRVRMRTEVLPLLDDVAQRDVTAVLARQAPLAAEESDLLDALAGEIDATDALALTAAPRALARRCLRAWLVRSGVGDGHPLDGACVERALMVATGAAVSCDLVAGWSLRRTQQRLRLVGQPQTAGTTDAPRRAHQ